MCRGPLRERSNHLRAMTENLAVLKMVETVRQMIHKKSSQKAEEEHQDIHLQIDSKKKATIFYSLKVVKEVILIESDDE